MARQKLRSLIEFTVADNVFGRQTAPTFRAAWARLGEQAVGALIGALVRQIPQPRVIPPFARGGVIRLHYGPAVLAWTGDMREACFSMEDSYEKWLARNLIRQLAFLWFPKPDMSTAFEITLYTRKALVIPARTVLTIADLPAADLIATPRGKGGNRRLAARASS